MIFILAQSPIFIEISPQQVPHNFYIPCKVFMVQHPILIFCNTVFPLHQFKFTHTFSSPTFSSYRLSFFSPTNHKNTSYKSLYFLNARICFVLASFSRLAKFFCIIYPRLYTYITQSALTR